MRLSNLYPILFSSVAKTTGPIAKKFCFFSENFQVSMRSILAHVEDGHEKIITWKFHWNRAQEINGGEPILSKICITENVQEKYKRDFTLQSFLFRQNMCRNFWWNDVTCSDFVSPLHSYTSSCQFLELCEAVGMLNCVRDRTRNI
jgi:hypothetical protein